MNDMNKSNLLKVSPAITNILFTTESEFKDARHTRKMVA
jgi:hypothetical protein